MRRWDVIVVGGGPIGAVAARLAAGCGAHVALLDRSETTDLPSPCTGLVSPRTLSALGVSEASILRRIDAVEAVSPSGRTLRLQADEPRGLVLDRTHLRAELHDRAREAGAEIFLGHEAVGLRPGHVEASGPGTVETMQAGVIVVAAGVQTNLQEAADLPTPPRPFVGVQAVVEDEAEQETAVRTFFGTETAPRFFGWAVPAEEGRTRVGLAAPPGVDPNPLLDRHLARWFEGRRILSRVGGRLPLHPLSEPYADGLLFVGDAAGQLKPLTGGGLYTGAICARIAGRVAAEAARTDRTGAEDLRRYASDCDRAIGDEVRFGLAARALLESLSDEAIDDAFAAADHPDLLQFLATHGDIDRLRQLPRRLASRRNLWKRLVPLMSLLDRHLGAAQRFESSDAVAGFPDESL